MNWTKISEKFPPEGALVVVACEKEEMYCAYWRYKHIKGKLNYEIRWIVCCNCEGNSICHAINPIYWMLIPAFPTEMSGYWNDEEERLEDIHFPREV